MDFESALTCLRAVDLALSKCELEPSSVLAVDASGQLDRFGTAIQTLAGCQTRWGSQRNEIKRLAVSVSTLTARFRTVFNQGDRYCYNRLSISSVSTSGYANPAVVTPVSIPGGFEAEG